MEFYWDHTQQLKAKSSIKCEKKNFNLFRATMAKN